MTVCCCSSPACQKYGCQSWASVKPTMGLSYFEPSKQGWICPNCGKANAPWMPSCCKGEKVSLGASSSV